jgi:hypothetical protein
MMMLFFSLDSYIIVLSRNLYLPLQRAMTAQEYKPEQNVHIQSEITLFHT